MSQDDKKHWFELGRSFEYFQKVLQSSGPAASASYTLIASVLIFTLLGWFYDSSHGTSATWTLIGVGIGLLTGFYHLGKTIWTKKL